MAKGKRTANSESEWRLQPATGHLVYSDNMQVQKRFENILEGQKSYIKKMVLKFSEENKAIVAAFFTDYINTNNPKASTIMAYMSCIHYMITYMKGIKVTDMRAVTSDQLLSFLQSYRRHVDIDPDQKWINTYNQYGNIMLVFFKWLYYPNIPQRQREKPPVVQNIHFYQKKNLTSVKPEDLWTIDEDSLFLKYCPDPRVALYHTHSLDTSGRPYELLAKRIGDFRLKNFEGKIYGEQEIGRGGKTSGRIVPLISSIPYFKAWIAAHPQGTNPNAFVYISLGKRDKYRNKPIEQKTLYYLYAVAMKRYFAKLLERPDVPPEDKAVIQGMMQKPWNPYLRRHMSLTEKARLVNEYQLRLHAGWSKNSKMINIYTHELGGESSKAFLQAYNIIPKDAGKTDGIIMPKECPECREPNKPDSLYCTKCNFALSIKASVQKDERIAELTADLEKTRKEMKDEIEMSRKWRMNKFRPSCDRCGFVNELDALNCSKCNAVLEGVIYDTTRKPT